MSLDDLAKAQTQIEATVKERDALRVLLEKEQYDHNRTKDRLQLLNVELEKWQADAKMYMRLATKFATKVADIHTLAAKAKELVVELANEELMEGETAQEREDATKVAQRFAPEDRSWENGREQHRKAMEEKHALEVARAPTMHGVS